MSGELAGEPLRLMDRRELLRLVGWATTTAAGALISLDEWDRLVGVVEAPRRVDAQAIDSLSMFLRHCKRQEDALGPSMVHGTVLAQHGIVRRLPPECPARVRPRLLSLHSDMAATIGGYLVDLNNHDRAQHYLSEARIAGHEAGNRVHPAYALSEASFSAYLRGETCTAMDTAAAARNLAAHTDDSLVKVLADQRAAAAHALDGQHATCVAACARAREGSGSGSAGRRVARLLGALGHDRQPAQRLSDEARQAAGGGGSRPGRCRTMALVLCEEIGEAARILGGAAGTARASPSPRLIAELRAARAQPRPWQGTHAVKTLDAQLAACGVLGPSPSCAV